MPNPLTSSDPLKSILYHLQGDAANYILENIPHPVFLVNEAYHITHCNQPFCSLLKLERSQILDRPLNAFFSAPSSVHFKTVIEDLWNASLAAPSVAELTPVLGSSKCHMTLKRMVIGEQTIAVLGTVIYHPNEKAAASSSHSLIKYTELMLKINQSLLEKTSEQELMDFIMTELYAVFGHKDCGCILIDRDGHLKMVSQVGYTEEAKQQFDILTEKSYFWRYANGNINQVYRINQIDLIEQEDYTKVAPSKSGMDMLSSISAPLIIDGKLYGLINFDSPVRDAFTEDQVSIMEYVRTQLSIAIKNMQLYEKIIKLSRYDQLTELMNRHYFEECITLRMEQCKASGESLVLVVCDVDYLKQVNDSMGHLIGDHLLKACADTLKLACGKNALVARFGGDEFVAVVPGSDELHLSAYLEEGRRLLMTQKAGKWPYSFSFGLSVMTESDFDYYSILKRADLAMYHEKEFRMKGRRATDR